MQSDDETALVLADMYMRPITSYLPRPRSDVEAIADLAREKPDTALAMMRRIERGRMRVAAIEGVCDAARTIAHGASNALMREIELGGGLELGEEISAPFHVGAPIPGTGGFFCGSEQFGISGSISIRRRRCR